MDNQDNNSTEPMPQALVCGVATGGCLPAGDTGAPGPVGKFVLPLPGQTANSDADVERTE